MNLYNDSITIYNRYSVGLPPFPPRVRYDRTFIKNVHWEDETVTNPDSNGRPTISQTALVLIPADADQSGKTYIGPNEFAKLSNDTDNYWTANADPSNPDFIVLGEGREINDLYTVDNLRRDYKTIVIHAIANMLNSNILPHLEIRGL